MNKFVNTGKTLHYDSDETQFEPSNTHATAGFSSNSTTPSKVDKQNQMFKDLEAEIDYAHAKNKQLMQSLENQTEKITKLEGELKQANEKRQKLINSFEILTERFETLKIMNERLQTQNLILERRLMDSPNHTNTYVAYAFEVIGSMLYLSCACKTSYISNRRRF